jgi:hypothetical protein
MQTLHLQLSKEETEMFHSFQEVLDHDEPEDTFKMMLHLMNQAIALTSKEQPVVRLYTRDPQKVSFEQVICPQCGMEVPIYRQVSDGFREGSVRLR